MSIVVCVFAVFISLGGGATGSDPVPLTGSSKGATGATASTGTYAERPGGSTEVLYSFPTNTDQVSVARTGAMTMALEIPVPPAYLQPKIFAYYNSQGGDGLLGMGWDIPLPMITLNLGEGFDVIDAVPDDYLVSNEVGQRFLSDRWIAYPGGPLVCEERGKTAASWSEFDCFTNPLGSTRYKASGEERETSWEATDPLEGVVQTFGGSAASRLERDGKPVAWLLSEEHNGHGQTVRHLYQESNAERLRVAIVLGQNKVIRFIYEDRDKNRHYGYQLGIKRGQTHLLKEIQLLDGCEPTQDETYPDLPTVDFTPCAAATILERVVLEYANPAERYTGRYVLSSWRHESGDGTVSYRAVTFDYEGDTIPARGDGSSSSAIVETVGEPNFEIPDGFTLATATGYAPFQTYRDWNHDGVPDWIHTKTNDSAPWPTYDTTTHKIYVHLRNADGGFDARKAYDDPITRYSAWMFYAESGLYIQETPLDNWYHRLDSDPTDPSDIQKVLASSTYWNEANIGISVSPWMYQSTTRPEPIIESLSMSVDCEDLGSTVCDTLTKTYESVWNTKLGSSQHLSVKLSELVDMNGDGFLDRVISGLLVIWDPTATDAETDGLRDIANGDPCIYVSYFDPDADDFLPFTRYIISGSQEDFGELGGAFLSALAVSVLDNTDPSAADMSGQTSVAGPVTALGLGLGLAGVANDFVEAHAAMREYGDAADLTRDARGEGYASAVGLGISTVNAAAQWGHAPPEVLQALRFMSQSYSTVRMGVSFDKLLTTPSLTGWGSFGAAAAGAFGSYIVSVNAAKHMTTAGYNPGAVAANAKTTIAWIAIVSSVIGIFFTASAVNSWNPAGWGLAIITGILFLAVSVFSLISHEGSISFANGDVYYDMFSKRGIAWRETAGGTSSKVSVLSHESSNQLVLEWTDLNGDGRQDLVVARSSHSDGNYAIAKGATDWQGLETQPMSAWSFSEYDTGPNALSIASTQSTFASDDVQRSDLSDLKLGFMDMNGDGLIDLVQVDESVYGFKVRVNNGMGFDSPWTYTVDRATRPASCQTSVLALSRSRLLSWTEYVGKKEGYAVGLGNTIIMLGPDLDQNGLPDLVMKDETSYDTVSSADDCLLVSASTEWSMCEQVMPTDPEPESTGDCSAGEDVWYSNFDGSTETSSIRNEGETMLTRAANEVHSPLTKGIQFVAFNDGTSFEPFIKITQSLPSLAGSMSVVGVTNTDLSVPNDPAISGTASFLADPDANGRTELTAIDISSADVAELSGSHPIASQYRFGISNPDTLRAINYPEGGQVQLDYKLKKDIQGKQGSPLWVLSRATFNDQIATQDGWRGALPYVDYDYAGARWDYKEREFLGFEVVAESRFSGPEVTQIVERYEQDGPSRGSVLCREIRGKSVWDGDTIDREPEHPTCLDRSFRPSLPHTLKPFGEHRIRQDDSASVSSCIDEYASELSFSLYPLQERSTYEYADDETAWDSQAESDEILRDFVTRKVRVERYDGSSTPVTHTVTMEYDPTPYKTVVRTVVETSDGLKRSVKDEWEHHDEEWLFEKAKETKLNSDGSTYFETDYIHDKTYPFNLIELHESWNGKERVHTFSEFNSGGLPTVITWDGVPTRYTYYEDAPLLKTMQTQADFFQPIGQSELFSYDSMGRLVEHTSADGSRSSYSYDGIGALISDERAGFERRDYLYENIGRPLFDRSMTSLRQAQKSIMFEYVDGAETPSGERIITFTFWDGFYRRFRSGWFVDGTRHMPLQFEGPNGPTTVRGFTDDADWFKDEHQERNRLLLRDYRLNGASDIQCRSLTYFNTETPEAYESNLRDWKRRSTYIADFQGFGTQVRYDTQPSGSESEFWVNDLGQYLVKKSDALSRMTGIDCSGLESYSYEYDRWDHPVRRVDGRGFAEVREVNGWGEPLKVCAEVSPSGYTLSCPSDWPTTRYDYDGRGNVTEILDPNGAALRVTYSASGKPGRIDYPSASSSDGTRTSFELMSYDSSTRLSTLVERNTTTSRYEYDDAGRISAYTKGAGSANEIAWHYGYDRIGRRLYRESPRGYRNYDVLDFRGNTLYQLGPLNYEQSLTYDVKGAIDGYRDPEGLEVDVSTDLMGRVTKQEWDATMCEVVTETSVTPEVSGVAEDFEYDTKGRLIGYRRTGGGKVAFAYDSLDHLTRRYPADLGNPFEASATVYEEFAYDRSGFLSQYRDKAGQVTSFLRDGHGRVTDRIRSSAVGDLRDRYLYDLVGNLIHHDSPNASSAKFNCVRNVGGPNPFRTSIVYTPMNQVEKIVFPADENGRRQEIAQTYYPWGALETATDERGYTTRFFYDEIDRLRTRQLPDGTSRGWNYDRNGNVVETIDGRGLSTAMTYDALDRQIELKTPSSRQVYGHDLRDSLNFVASLADETAKRWETTLISYSPDGLPLAIDKGTFMGDSPVATGASLLSEEKICHTQSGLLNAVQDANGFVRKLEYDSRNRVKQEWLPPATSSGDWEVVTRKYDEDDRPVEVIRPMGGDSGPSVVSYRFKYDGFGRLIADWSSQVRAHHSLEYDADDNVCKESMRTFVGAGKDLTLQYSPRGELLRRNGPMVEEEYSYDEGGNLTHVADAGGTWDYTYDERGRPLTVAQAIRRTQTTFTTEYHYDANGDLESVDYPDIDADGNGPGTLQYTREDDTRRLKRADSDRGAVLEDLTYDGTGRTTHAGLGNGALWDDVYDELGNLRSRAITHGGNTEYSVTLERDSRGNITKVDDAIDDTFDFTYTYDQREQLYTEYAPVLGTDRWMFHRNDLGLVDSVEGPTESDSYELHYGSTGQLASLKWWDGTETVFKADVFGNRVTQGEDAFRYDGLNRLISLTIDGQSTDVVPAYDGRRVEYGNRVFVYGLDRLPLAELVLDDANNVSAIGYNVALGNTLLQTISGSDGTMKYFAVNHQDSPVVGMDQDPGKAAYRAYRAYGLTVERPAGSGADLPTDLGFQANYRDGESGWNFMLARYLDAKSFAFISPDPMGAASQDPLFQFASGDPINHTDRRGLQSTEDSSECEQPGVTCIGFPGLLVFAKPLDIDSELEGFAPATSTTSSTLLSNYAEPMWDFYRDTTSQVFWTISPYGVAYTYLKNRVEDSENAWAAMKGGNFIESAGWSLGINRRLEEWAQYSVDLRDKLDASWDEQALAFVGKASGINEIMTAYTGENEFGEPQSMVERSRMWITGPMTLIEITGGIAEFTNALRPGRTPVIDPEPLSVPWPNKAEAMRIQKSIQDIANTPKHNGIYQKPGRTINPKNSTISLAVGWKESATGWEYKAIVNASHPGAYAVLEDFPRLISKGYKLGRFTPEPAGFTWDESDVLIPGEGYVHAELLGADEFSAEGFLDAIIATSNDGCPTCIKTLSEEYPGFRHLNPKEK
jgi:RHS repeat-associated core domain